MSLRQIVREEVKAVFDSMPNEQQVKKMQKEMEKINSDFSQYRYGTSSSDPNFNVWAESHEAELLFDDVLMNLDAANHHAKKGSDRGFSYSMEEAEKAYKTAIKAYNKAKSLHKNVKKKK